MSNSNDYSDFNSGHHLDIGNSNARPQSYTAVFVSQTKRETLENSSSSGSFNRENQK